ncbi:cysteine hydrolase family protein [Enterococcus raffinosus]|uniref:Isochorismatase family protein n=1 Tax=Enterococcus raffinosus TaxID=71452 RepID=A0AAW8TH07_9ENTE|nr:isochorismatase family protein [Enterococcus raffinosus]MDT2524876.1 isochorismatase family protein [Enterococcus raffinosus]MDT2530019.1 isochorismatase family protein [Enterococcus raffinosus]MDT2535592.1 isochorismatase family protein [Enterococcus raffinosus]MDT2546118.1 isochorismatase family protein [Enterococcus raffinosus]MDT2554926.1 isochorismatase family protein [Enterococcus raffinosus]
MSKSALLVVDVQTGTIAPLIGKEPFLKNVNAVIDHFHKKRLPVVLIKKAGYGELSPKLHQEACDLVVTKVQMNTFKAAEFKTLMEENDFENFVVVGLMSNACVQATCKGALAEGFPVTLIEDAHDSVLKPMRNIWNKKLKNAGVMTMTTKEYMEKLKKE